MWIADLSIKRPVLATVMSTLLVLFGLVSLTSLSVREYPDIDPPVVTISTVYPGSSAEVIESTVTEILEDELVGVEGIKTMTSSSREELSSVIIEFNIEKNVDTAAQDVRDRVSRARGRLPDDIEEPIIAKQDTDAGAIMWLGLSGKNFSVLQITDYADRYIVDQLQTVPGVGRVILGGGREYAMRLWLDPLKMGAKQVTVADVENALRAENVEIPSGRVEGINREFTVRTQGEMTTPEAFNRLIVKRHYGQPVYLSDIGRAEIGAKNERSLIRFDGKPAIGLGIVKQSKANTLEVAKGVKAKLNEIRKKLPRGLTVEPAYDSSIFIEKSVEEVISSLYLAFFLVVAVTYIFLRSGRATLIPVLSIPISIVATFILMSTLGYTINIITLLGLTLTIGLVVDDSIVVLENIFRRIEEGEPPMQAAFNGIREIGFAVLATTFVLVSVFLPIAFVSGITGRLLREFALVVAGSVMISMFVSLTLTPMLCSRWLRPEDAELASGKQIISNSSNLVIKLWQNFLNGFDDFFKNLNTRYASSLKWTLDKPKWVLIPILIMIVLCGGMYFILPKEFIPNDDESNIFTIVSSPEGSTMEYTDKAVRQAEEIYKSVPEVVRMFSVIALSAEGVGRVNNGIMFVGLKEPQHRSLKQQEIVGSLIPRMLSIPEAFVFPINPPSGPGVGFGKPIEMAIQGDDINELAAVAERIKNRSEKEVMGFIQADTDLKLNKPQLNISVDREKASALGVSVREVARTMQVLLGGLNLSTFRFNNKRYDVMVQAERDARLTPDQLNGLFVRGTQQSNGLGSSDSDESTTMIPLTNVMQWKEAIVPPELPHYNRLRAATVNGAMAPIPGLGKDKVLNGLYNIAKEEISPGMSIAWKGESKEFFDTNNAIFFAFGIALLVVFLVLAAQFESWSDPFIVMMTVPLAICGGILTLFILTMLPAALSFIPFMQKLSLVSFSINIYSQIAMIMLIGLVTKNGILIVEFANQIHEKKPGISYREAVMEASMTRLRPILMTSSAMIISAVPIFIGLGAGIDSRKPIGAVIVGGLTLCTFLTLYVIPIVYVWVKNWFSQLQKKSNQDSVVEEWVL